MLSKVAKNILLEKKVRNKLGELQKLKGRGVNEDSVDRLEKMYNKYRKERQHLEVKGESGRGADNSVDRDKLLRLVRQVHRKKQDVFSDISPQKRENLRMLAEKMLHIKHDSTK